MLHIKKIKKIICALFAAMLIFAQVSFAEEYSSEWAALELDSAYGYGLVPESLSAADFRALATRRDFCEIAVALYEKLTDKVYKPESNAPFYDVYNISVTKAYELGLVSGTSENTFEPDNNTTRQEAAKILTNLMAALKINKPTGDAVLEVFTDRGAIAEWARDAAALMVSTGYMNGVSENEFSPLSNITLEQAEIISIRFFLQNAENTVLPSNITITSPEFDSFTWGNDVTVTWEKKNAPANVAYTVTVPNAGFSEKTPENSIIIPAGKFTDGEEYILYISSNDKISARPVRFFAGNRNIRVLGKNNLRPDNEQKLTINWTTVPEAADYTVTVVQNRVSGDTLVPPSPQTVYNTWGNLSYTLEVLPNRVYDITVKAVDEHGWNYDYEDKISVYSSYGRSWSYSSNYTETILMDREDINFDTKEDADANMKNVTVPVWKIGKNGAKIPDKATFTVHAKLAGAVYEIFEEIYNGDERFPIKDVGGYNWRAPMSSGRLSEHNYGTAIDINSNENYCLYTNGTTVGSFWKPYENQYSITPYGDVITAFERRGFTWGGDAWNNPKDYMHFSYFGT